MKLFWRAKGKNQGYTRRLDERGRLVPPHGHLNHIWTPDHPAIPRLCILQATAEERAALTAAGYSIPDCSPEQIMGFRGGSATGPGKRRGAEDYYSKLAKKRWIEKAEAQASELGQPLEAPAPRCPTCRCLVDMHEADAYGEARCKTCDRGCGWIISGRA